MNRYTVIGTAGHVDHGKTALVKALTGTDTDRWEEEKRRGITIDIGFAELGLGDDLSAGIVDVPGHEDFVRNMLAGATGIDIGLLVIAADEGMMPQTEEHLNILEFLGIPAGVAVLSKADLVDEEWLELVRSEVSERLDRSPIRWEEPVAASAVTGLGLDVVKETISRVARDTAARDTGDLFRMPVDRVFSVRGTGTVVTGTTWSGSVAVGEQVTLLPERLTGRIRGIEVHGRKVERATPGRRTALALAGVDRDGIRRGTTVVADPGWPVTEMMDVDLTLLENVAPLGQRARVRVHHGTSEVLARVTPLKTVEPGMRMGVRLRLEEPIVARWGDRGVIRSYSPVTTIGGFTVVDPAPPRRPRRPLKWLAKANRDESSRLFALVAEAGTRGLPVDEVSYRTGIHPERVETVSGALSGIHVAQGRLFDNETVQEAFTRAVRAVQHFQNANDLTEGMRLEEFRRLLGAGALADLVLELGVKQGRLTVEGAFVTAGRKREAPARETVAELDRVSGLLAAAGPEGLTAQDLDHEFGARAPELLAYLVRQGTAVKVHGGRYYNGEVLAGLTRRALRRIACEGGAKPADLRDELGLSRKFLIPLLEWLDEQGLTVRREDRREIGPKGREHLDRELDKA